MSIKVILKSPESIKLFMDKYFSQNAFTIDVSGEIKLEQETTDIAVDVFKLLLENNLVSFEHVEFSNTAESFPTTKTTEKKNKENKDKVLKNTAQSIKEQIYVLLCNIAPGKLTTTEIVEKLQLKYPSVSSALCQLYKDGKVDKEKKKYFIKTNPVEPEEVAADTKQIAECKDQEEEKKQSTDSGATASEQKSAVRPEVVKTKEEGISKEEHSTLEESELKERALPEYTPLEKAKTMVEVFSNERYTAVLYYMFFKRKGNFEVAKIRTSLGEREAENIATIINLFATKGIISFNEKLPPEGRYEIAPIWRIYAILIKNVEPMEEGSIRTAVELGDKEFQKIMKQALADEIVERTDIKRVTRYAVAKM